MKHLEDKEVTVGEFLSPASIARLRAKIQAQNAPPNAHKPSVLDTIEKVLIIGIMVALGAITFSVCFQLLAKGLM